MAVASLPAQDKPADAPGEPPSEGRPDEAKRLADVEARMQRRRHELMDRLYGSRPDRPQPVSATEEEWRSIADAMKQHSPNWWQRFEHLPENGPVRERMKRTMIETYRNLARIEQRDPQQYKREIRQLQLEDEIFGIGRELWQTSGSSANAEELKSKLRQRITELINLRITGREERLTRLTETLAKEREKLEADKRDRDTMVQRKFDAVLTRKLEGGGLLGSPGVGPGPAPNRLGPPGARPPLGPPPGRGKPPAVQTAPASPAQ